MPSSRRTSIILWCRSVARRGERIASRSMTFGDLGCCPATRIAEVDSKVSPTPSTNRVAHQAGACKQKKSGGGSRSSRPSGGNPTGRCAGTVLRDFHASLIHVPRKVILHPKPEFLAER